MSADGFAGALGSGEEEYGQAACPWRSHSRPEGMEPCDCLARLALVTTHTRTPTPVGPDYCAECTRAINEWVPWTKCPAEPPTDDREAQDVEALLVAHEPTLGVFAGMAGVVGCACMDARQWREYLGEAGAYDPPFHSQLKVADYHRAHVAAALAARKRAAGEKARADERKRIALAIERVRAKYAGRSTWVGFEKPRREAWAEIEDDLRALTRIARSQP